ncbi:YqaJ viral recombinase family protein [Elizabethkingia anophelis]|nr:YqaJ viral recombinase family protein [Elizabethkingia anophelis]MCT4092779.1 YqaJ viral recombinase family protein [Elizabethkingia anophelis]
MIKYAVFDTEEAWLDFRAPYFTSSEVTALLPEAKKKGETLSVGAKTYITKCAASVLATPPPPQYNQAMEHGKATESYAVMSLARHLGKSIDDDDFIYTSTNGFVFFYDDEYNLGGTPDVIMKALKKSAEIKCPNSDTHLEHLTLRTPEDVKINLPKYYGQMQSNMYLTGTDECIFMSFDNRFYNDKLHEHYINIPKDDEYIERLLIKAKAAKAYKEEILKTLNK